MAISFVGIILLVLLILAGLSVLRMLVLGTWPAIRGILGGGLALVLVLFFLLIVGRTSTNVVSRLPVTAQFGKSVRSQGLMLGTFQTRKEALAAMNPHIRNVLQNSSACDWQQEAPFTLVVSHTDPVEYAGERQFWEDTMKQASYDRYPFAPQRDFIDVQYESRPAPNGNPDDGDIGFNEAVLWLADQAMPSGEYLIKARLLSRASNSFHTLNMDATYRTAAARVESYQVEATESSLSARAVEIQKKKEVQAARIREVQTRKEAVAARYRTIATVAAVPLMVLLGYLFLSARRGGPASWMQRIGATVAFGLLCLILAKVISV